VREHGSAVVNQTIDRRTLVALERSAAASMVGIGRRLRALDREWDIDRAVMATFAVLGTVSATNAIRVARRRRVNGWTVLFGVQMSFLLYHAVAGWSPPVAVLRRLGLRTQREIEAERRALDRLLDDRIEAAGS
jgi:hypothetical protein